MAIKFLELKPFIQFVINHKLSIQPSTWGCFALRADGVAPAFCIDPAIVRILPTSEERSIDVHQYN